MALIYQQIFWDIPPEGIPRNRSWPQQPHRREPPYGSGFNPRLRETRSWVFKPRVFKPRIFRPWVPAKMCFASGSPRLRKMERQMRPWSACWPKPLAYLEATWKWYAERHQETRSSVFRRWTPGRSGGDWRRWANPCQIGLWPTGHADSIMSANRRQPASSLNLVSGPHIAIKGV